MQELEEHVDSEYFCICISHILPKRSLRTCTGHKDVSENPGLGKCLYSSWQNPRDHCTTQQAGTPSVFHTGMSNVSLYIAGSSNSKARFSQLNIILQIYVISIISAASRGTPFGITMELGIPVITTVGTYHFFAMGCIHINAQENLQSSYMHANCYIGLLTIKKHVSAAAEVTKIHSILPHRASTEL